MPKKVPAQPDVPAPAGNEVPAPTAARSTTAGWDGCRDRDAQTSESVSKSKSTSVQLWNGSRRILDLRACEPLPITNNSAAVEALGQLRHAIHEHYGVKTNRAVPVPERIRRVPAAFSEISAVYRDRKGMVFVEMCMTKDLSTSTGWRLYFELDRGLVDGFLKAASFDAETLAEWLPCPSDGAGPPGEETTRVQAKNVAKGTAGAQKKRRGRRRSALTKMENKVWSVYQKHEGEHGCYFQVAEILEPEFPNISRKLVEQIVRKNKARRSRDNKAS
jgi:hypothetical protein